MGLVHSATSWCLQHLLGIFHTQNPHQKPSEQPYGIVGNGSLSKNVKILYINGIRNSRQDAEESAQKISAVAHSAIDLCHTSLGFQDAYFPTSRVKQAGKNALTCIQKLLTSSKTNQVQLIIITHSAGGLVLKEASSHLSQEEKRKITLVTLGSTYMFPKQIGFQKIINFLNTRDLFSSLARIRKSGGEITFIGKEVPKKSWSPIQEHFVTSPAYQEALKSFFQKIHDELHLVDT